jgi:hypothetical protein
VAAGEGGQGSGASGSKGDQRGVVESSAVVQWPWTQIFLFYTSCVAGMTAWH